MASLISFAEISIFLGKPEIESLPLMLIFLYRQFGLKQALIEQVSDEQMSQKEFVLTIILTIFFSLALAGLKATATTISLNYFYTTIAVLIIRKLKLIGS